MTGLANNPEYAPWLFDDQSAPVPGARNEGILEEVSQKLESLKSPDATSHRDRFATVQECYFLLKKHDADDYKVLSDVLVQLASLFLQSKKIDKAQRAAHAACQLLADKAPAEDIRWVYTPTKLAASFLLKGENEIGREITQYAATRAAQEPEAFEEHWDASFGHFLTSNVAPRVARIYGIMALREMASQMSPSFSQAVSFFNAGSALLGLSLAALDRDKSDLWIEALNRDRINFAEIADKLDDSGEQREALAQLRYAQRLMLEANLYLGNFGILQAEVSTAEAALNANTDSGSEVAAVTYVAKAYIAARLQKPALEIAYHLREAFFEHGRRGGFDRIQISPEEVLENCSVWAKQQGTSLEFERAVQTVNKVLGLYVGDKELRESLATEPSPQFEGFEKKGEWTYVPTDSQDINFLRSIRDVSIAGQITLTSGATLPKAPNGFAWYVKDGLISLIVKKS